MSRSTRHRGSTLIELIAAMLIVGVAVPPILAVVSSAISRQHESIDRRRAVLLAEAVIETVLADAYTATEVPSIADAAYPDSVASRLGEVGAYYESLGYSWGLEVAGPVDATGAETGGAMDLYYLATATVRFPSAKGSGEASYAVSTLVTEFPPDEDDDAGVVVGPHPLGWPTRFLLHGIEGKPKNKKRWFAVDDGESIYTNRANQPITYSADGGPPSVVWSVGITVKNFSVGGLPPGYKTFSVDVRANGKKVGTVKIPASDTEWNTVWIDIGERSGTMDVQLTWKNRKKDKAGHEANLQIGAIQFASDPDPPPDDDGKDDDKKGKKK